GQVDAFAAQSFARAVAAQTSGFLAGEIAPIKNETFERAPYQPRALKLKGLNELAADTHVRPSPLETLAAIRPAVGVVQTGVKSSAIVDGAAAALVASSDYVRSCGKAALARVVAGATVGVPPDVMGIGPVPAIKAVLERAGLKLSDIDRFEINEAFGAQVMACMRELGIDEAKLNVTAAPSPSALPWARPASGSRSRSRASSSARGCATASPRPASAAARASRCSSRIPTSHPHGRIDHGHQRTRRHRDRRRLRPRRRDRERTRPRRRQSHLPRREPARRRRARRQHPDGVGRRPGRTNRPGRLFRLQGRHRRAHAAGGARVRAVRHPRQRHRAGHLSHADADGVAGGGAEEPRRGGAVSQTARPTRSVRVAGAPHHRKHLYQRRGDPPRRRAPARPPLKRPRGQRMLVNRRLVRIEWGDCDPAGIVYYPRYFAIFDASTTALIERALGMSKHDYLKAYDFSGHPLVNARSRFLIATRFGDEVTIETTVTALRRSSF